MKSLKAIFAFFVPLLAMLITFCIFLLIDNIVDNYKNKISRDYSIVLVATNPIKKESLNELAGIKVENIQLLPNEKIIENIKSNLSDNSKLVSKYEFLARGRISCVRVLISSW